MLRPPRSFAEILATAKRAPHRPILRPRTPEIDPTFHGRLSEFSSLNTTLSDESTTPCSRIQSGPTNVNQISNLRFLDSVTPQTLEAALEIKEMPRNEHNEVDLHWHEWVFIFTLYVVQ